MASHSGVLASASVLVIAGTSAESDPLQFSLVRVMENGGFSEALDTASIPFSMIPQTLPCWEQPYGRDYSVTAAFTGEADLFAGERYALIVGSLGDLGSHYRIWMPLTVDSHPEGAYFKNTINGIQYSALSQDLFFKIEADVIPEVSSALMLIASLLGLGASRRR